VLLPQVQVKEEGYEGVIEGVGFHVVPMPFANDIRDVTFPELEPSPKPSEVQVEAAMGVVKGLSFKDNMFMPDPFEHPELQKHW
jgi:hypothetical protein